MARDLLLYLPVKGGSLPSAPELALLFRGFKHARFYDPSVVYHVLLRCFQGRFLLRPDRRGVLNGIVAGVIGRAQERWPTVRLFAHAWLSNHAHLLVQGSPDDLPAFIGFISREISRRWGRYIGWPDRMWQRYDSTALVGPESERRALRYVLAQGAKEHLVASPLHWPGVHCATELAAGKLRQGSWLNGTAYARAVHAQRGAATPKRVRKQDFTKTYEVDLARLPSCRHMSDEEYRTYVIELVRKIEAETARTRRATGQRVLGRRRVLRASRETRSELPPQPWYEKRRRMIVWARRTEATLAYLRRYWTFQRHFRVASRRFCSGDILAPFPRGAFRPSVFTA